MDSENFTQMKNIDYNYVIMNRGLKYFIFAFVSLIFTYYILNNDQTTYSFVKTLLVCTLSVVLFYILDLTFPSCHISCDP